mmetsp:Transcript_10065/g.25064  ORF Transcript_10065/g.25064 Transcript_10065/m.25064 type:complete len:211 (-) Transcript_10065:1123-1755(-)
MYARRKAKMSGSASASSTKRCPQSIAVYESAECDELSRRSFISSYGSTLDVTSTSAGRASCHCGRPAQKLSSITHCRKGSAMTGHSSSTPYSSRSRARCSGSVAGVMRSTIELGKGTALCIQLASPVSTARANCSVTARQTEPFIGMLSQLRTVSGPWPAARRRCSTVQMRPKAVLGWRRPRAPPSSSAHCSRSSLTSALLVSSSPSTLR